MTWPSEGIRLLVKNVDFNVRRVGNSILAPEQTKEVHFENLSYLRSAVLLDKSNDIEIMSEIPSEILELLAQSGTTYVPTPPPTPPPSPTTLNLDSLTDVDVSSTKPMEGNVLKYVDGIWKPSAESGGTGTQGPKGDTGASAYDIWLGGGHTGTETDFLNSLKGPKGDTGAAGTLAGLSDVDATNKADGYGLVYNNTTNKFVFSPLGAGGTDLDGGDFTSSATGLVVDGGAF